MKVVEGTLNPLREVGVRILNYLDDWLILAQYREQLGNPRDLVLQHLSQLGLRVNWEKSKLSPVQRIHGKVSLMGKNVASVAPFSGRLASLPLRQAVTTNRKDLKLSFTEGRNPFRFRGERNSGLAISSSDVLSGPGGHQG